MILGIDVGGTSVKFGIVSENGDINGYRKFDTQSLIHQSQLYCGLYR
jgi:predicted NBD/HSP70 family sugar kinase